MAVGQQLLYHYFRERPLQTIVIHSYTEWDIPNIYVTMCGILVVLCTVKQASEGETGAERKLCSFSWGYFQHLLKRQVHHDHHVTCRAVQTTKPHVLSICWAVHPDVSPLEGRLPPEKHRRWKGQKVPGPMSGAISEEFVDGLTKAGCCKPKRWTGRDWGEMEVVRYGDQKYGGGHWIGKNTTRNMLWL